MDEALDKIKKKTMTIYAASKFYKIPKTTLVQRTQGRAKSQIGRPTIFDETAEVKIKNWLIDMANVGMPVTKKLLKGASILAHKMNLDQKVIGTCWARNFFKRHSSLSIRKAQTLPKHRILVSKQDIKTWFQKITEYMDKNDLLSVFEDPNRIWNLIGESSFDLCPSIKNAIEQKNKRLNNITAYSDNESFSVMIPITQSLGKSFIWMNDFPKDWVMGKSAKGYQMSQTFYNYISGPFIEFLRKNNVLLPIILFLDGHKSHLRPSKKRIIGNRTLDLGQFCRENGIVIICLPPNCTHFAQPLDRVYFHVAKDIWTDIVTEWRMKNLGVTLPKRTFVPLLQTAIAKTQENPTLIPNGFKCCGL